MKLTWRATNTEYCSFSHVLLVPLELLSISSNTSSLTGELPSEIGQLSSLSKYRRGAIVSRCVFAFLFL